MKACPRKMSAAIVENEVDPFENVSAIFHFKSGSFRSKINALFDSGSPVTMIEAGRVPQGHHILKQKFRPSGFNGAGNVELKTLGIITFDVMRAKKIYNNRWIH